MFYRSRCVFAVLVFIASVFSSTGQADDSHRVAGIATQVFADSQLTTIRNLVFSAQSFRNGTALGIGVLDIRRSNGTSKTALLSIQSIAVERNQSVLIGRILWSSEATEIGIPAIFGVEDNGEGRKQKNPDRMTTILGFVVGDAFTPDYTIEQLSDLARDGALTPINFGEDLQLGFELPLVNLTLGNIQIW